jgi:hypothetical protein
VDSYGIVDLGSHLLSIPGLLLYLGFVAGGLLLVGRLVSGIPLRFRLLNLFLYGLSSTAVISWMFIALGLNFYVEA